GLDEMKPEHREVVVNSFANFRIKNEGNKVVFTGRPHGMEGAAINRFGGNHIKILSLNMEQIEAFIRKWFYYVYSEGSRIGEKNAEAMISEMKEHPDVGMLRDNPLMLTAICVLYHDGKELPGQRAELYKQFIKNLLYRRFGNDSERVHEFLRILAFKTNVKKIRGEDRVFFTEILKLVYEKDDGEKDNDYRKRIEDLFDYIEPRCGLLRFEKSQYLFWHLTFQEFLTAVYIVYTSTDYEKVIRAYWDDEHYKEVIELYIGYLSIENRKWANHIVENIVKAEEKAPFKRWLLASKSIIDIHKDSREKNALNTARERLLTIINTNIEPKIRVEAGETLGWLGDTRDLKEFILVEEGKYTLSQGEVDISSFEIGKYPVTNCWFEEFINASGYKNKEYWSDEGKMWLKRLKAEQPERWNDRKWKCPNSPVVGVSWYEVYAFTRWLTIELNDGYEYSLPDENEWEAVASGRERRKYTWGNEWDKDKCNNNEINIEKTSPVGIFKRGNSPEGIADLSGNVWEWTDSWYDEKKKKFVLRGGSWGSACDNCWWAYRHRNEPGIRNNIGFRCARTLKL
ncbi:MAG: SUMF1/EgtB/PvdO family nonheme iron enzyme, partial [Deltaproteobacteria bacterium]|nr:SUMF1/EgtB/PvdO family nonheme iron enzyme [Deltaproteobacteria bacterium]